jgi:hypothetical protein
MGRPFLQDGGSTAVGANVASGSAAANNGRRRSKKHQQKSGGGGERGGARQRSRYERYMDVEAFWKSTTPEQRKELLRVPMSSLLQGGGGGLVATCMDGLIIDETKGTQYPCRDSPPSVACMAVCFVFQKSVFSPFECVAVRQDHGPDATEEVVEGLVLLREQGNCTARYWACPVCDQRFSASKVRSSLRSLWSEGNQMPSRYE